jgi:hypothetical protein
MANGSNPPEAGVVRVSPLDAIEDGVVGNRSELQNFSAV